MLGAMALSILIILEELCFSIRIHLIKTPNCPLPRSFLGDLLGISHLWCLETISPPQHGHSASTERPHGTLSINTSTASDTHHDTASDTHHDTASDTHHDTASDTHHDTAPDILHDTASDARHGAVPDATRRAARDNQQPAPMLSPRRSNRTRKPNVRLEGYQWLSILLLYVKWKFLLELNIDQCRNAIGLRLLWIILRYMLLRKEILYIYLYIFFF